MNDEKTLKELCQQLKISRRTIQGYQNKGLIQADGKNKYGHLLFKDETIKRIAFIRFGQMVGFSLDEIVELKKNTVEEIKSKFEQKVEQLINQQENLKILQNKTKGIISILNKDFDLDEIFDIIQKEEI